MKKIILLFSFVSFPIFAQINFETGYFINNNNVKTDCLIRNIGWQKNPTEIEYKLNENDETQKVTIFEIKEFNVADGYKYKRFKVNIDRSSSDINNLSKEKNLIWKEETLLLKILVDGEINLYQYEDINLVRYFISSGNHETAEQLVYKEYNAEYSDIGVNNYFRQQLLNTFKLDILSIKDFEKLSYKKKELTSLILKYNGTTTKKATNYEIKQNQGNLNIKIIAGANLSSLSFRNGSTVDYTFDKKTVFLLGFETEYIFPFNQNKWSIFVAPNFQSYKKEERTTSNQSVSSDYSYIEIPFGLRYYMFLNNNSKIFMNAGLAPQFTSKSTLKYSSAVLEVSNTIGYFIGAGFSKSRYNIELRYNLGRNLIPSYPFWDSNYNSVSVLVGYKIF